MITQGGNYLNVDQHFPAGTGTNSSSIQTRMSQSRLNSCRQRGSKSRTIERNLSSILAITAHRHTATTTGIWRWRQAGWPVGRRVSAQLSRQGWASQRPHTLSVGGAVGGTGQRWRRLAVGSERRHVHRIQRLPHRELRRVEQEDHPRST